MATPAAVVLSASGNGITIQTRSSTLLRRGLRISGVIAGARQGTVVEIQRRGRATHWRWAPTARAPVAAGGVFTAFWRAGQIGQFQIRAVHPLVVDARTRRALRTATRRSRRRPRRSALDRRARRSDRLGVTASPALEVIVYQPGFATLYGPGLYGNRTACGERLRPTTIGVANRTLPCGTEVSIDYRGRALVVPVIDRGPYANGADWDLTIATARALGMRANAWIGAIALPRRPPAGAAP